MSAPVISAVGAAVMSSREIAELCGKRHDHVMRDIREMLTELHGKEAAPKFGGRYVGQDNTSRPCFFLPKRETLILVSGYKLTLRARIIDRWQELEDDVRRQQLAQAGARELEATPAINVKTPDGRAELQAALEFVRTAARTFGRVAGQRAWDLAGLPCLLPEAAEGLLAARLPSVAEWMQERLQMRPGERVQSSLLYADFVAWAAARQLPAPSQKAFSATLAESGLRSVKSSSVWWLDVAVKEIAVGAGLVAA